MLVMTNKYTTNAAQKRAKYFFKTGSTCIILLIYFTIHLLAVELCNHVEGLLVYKNP